MNRKRIKIGYQGIEGSFSEMAAKKFISENNLEEKFDEIKLVPLVSSGNVVSELEMGKIDYGVLAVENSTAGTVLETNEALRNLSYKVVYEKKLPIHHCVYIKEDMDMKDINLIASHEQAIRQTSETRKRLMSNVMSIEVEDTALAAKQLSEGQICKETAVICSKNAGELFGLKLVYENIEDNADNITTFIAIKLV